MRCIEEALGKVRSMGEEPVLDMGMLVEIQRVGKPLYEKIALDFGEGERVFRLAQGTYVSEEVWDGVWKGLPSTWREAWQLISNGSVQARDLCGSGDCIAQHYGRPRPLSEKLSLVWSEELTHALAPQPAGRAALAAIERVADELDDRVQQEFASGAPVFRINDAGDYVAEKDWNEVWTLHPGCWEEAWMLADNGSYRADEVAQMTIGEIARAYSDPEYCPEIAFYTEAE